MTKMQQWNTDWIYTRQNWNEIDVNEELEGQEVVLPHTWYSDEDYYQGEAAYQKKFTYKQTEGNRVFVKFYGVDRESYVILNGHKLCHHQGGYNIFTVELTEELVDGENLMTVLVSNAKTDKISPLSGDFAVFGGIHRKVELITTGEACFDRTYYGTDGVVLQTKSVDGINSLWADVRVLGAADYSVVYTISDVDGILAEASDDHEAGMHEICQVENVKNWNGLDDTTLYTVSVALVVDGEIVDEVSRKVGFREIAIDANNGFFLNKVHTKLHGVAKHQDSAEVYSAATMENWKQDMDLIHEIGANAVRLSHYPHPQEVYDLCDEMGFVVWAEIPLLKLTEDDELFENAKYQLTEMILQNMHHPSIAFWGLQNEIAIYGEFPYMTEKVQLLNELTHRLDDTRFSACANLNVVHSDSSLNRITDVTAYNIYYGWYYGEFEDHGAFLDEFHATNPDMPLAISEYGADTNIIFHSDNPQVSDYTEEYQALYHEKVYPSMESRDFVWGSFVWNMFDFTSPCRQAADVTNRNIKGLVTFDRKTRKDSFYYYKAKWSQEPFVHIGSKRFVNRATETISIKVYSNQPEVTIEINDDTLTGIVENGSAVFENVALVMGENRVVATAGNERDEAIFIRCEEPDESYIYVDQNPGINVRNWFLDEKSEAELFPEDRISLRSTINEILASQEAVDIVRKRMPDVADGLQDMMGTFSFEKYFQYVKPDYTEEEVKALNEELTHIVK